MHDVLNQAFRKQIIEEIEGDENKRRKAEHQKRQDIFNNKQRKYVLDMLVKEFSESTVRDMRTCTSINLVKRIINEQASIYKSKPERVFENASENEVEQIEQIYNDSKIDVKLKKANQKYKLHGQCAIQIVPKMDGIKMRVLAPHQYDVIPSMEDPEVAEVYVVSGYNKDNLMSEIDGLADIQGRGYYAGQNEQSSDLINQTIADKDDWRKKKIYAWWTAQYNFLTDETGTIISPPEQIENPIQMLPFVDVSPEKDGEFYIDSDSSTVAFNLDFSVVLSDTCNTNRLQSYAQAVITGEKLPENITVGPNNILFLPLDPTKPELKPSFEFVSPNPNMEASIDLQDRLLSYFLTSEGIDPKTISGKAEGEKYASGLERLLATIEKFEASQDDLELFRWVEKQSFDIIKAWASLLPQFPVSISDGTKLSVQFKKPEFVKTASEAEESVIKRMEAGLISKVEAIMELRGVSKEEAERIAQELEPVPPMPQRPMIQQQMPAEESGEEDDSVDTEQQEGQ